MRSREAKHFNEIVAAEPELMLLIERGIRKPLKQMIGFATLITRAQTSRWEWLSDLGAAHLQERIRIGKRHPEAFGCIRPRRKQQLHLPEVQDSLREGKVG